MSIAEELSSGASWPDPWTVGGLGLFFPIAEDVGGEVDRWVRREALVEDPEELWRFINVIEGLVDPLLGRLVNMADQPVARGLLSEMVARLSNSLSRAEAMAAAG